MNGRNWNMASISTSRIMFGWELEETRILIYLSSLATGNFSYRLGTKGQGRGSNDTVNLGAAANMIIDTGTNELYVADGYVNHRIIVFDATTGAYKRHWGAYGKRPDDSFFTQSGEKLPPPFSGQVQHENKPSQYDPLGPPAPQFRIVHAVRISE